LACWASCAFFFTVSEIVAIEAEVSSRLAACSSVRCDRSVVLVEISEEALATSRAATLNSPTIFATVSSRSLTPPQRSPMSPDLPSSGMRLVRSLFLAAATASCVCCTALTVAVTSVAYLTTLNGLPFMSRIGL